MRKLFIMVGVPGSGKSTAARRLAEKENAVILSSDKVRKEVFGDENDQAHNEEVFKLLYKQLNESLIRGNVVMDATNTSLKARKRIFDATAAIRKQYPISVIAYVIPASRELCIEQDKKRERQVGEEVIDKFIKSFQFPQKFEGFDDIIIDTYGKDVPKYDSEEAMKVLTSMSTFDQKNPHHIFSLLKHCTTLEVLCFGDKIKRNAALYHDVGKLFTQSFDDKGIAHYYSHDSVGTYYLLDKLSVFDLDNWDEIYEALFYINYHMKARDIQMPKAERKYRSIFGNERYESLIDFAEKDKIASGTDIKDGTIVRRENI